MLTSHIQRAAVPTDSASSSRWASLALVLVAVISPLVATQTAEAQRRDPRWGVHAEVGGMFWNHLAMGGGALAFRLRPVPWLGVDLGVGGYHGVNYDKGERTEVNFTASFFYFVNPRDALQLYFVAAADFTVAEVDTSVRFPPEVIFIDYTTERSAYVGGQLGLGVEWRLGRHVALNTDLRGFLRRRTTDTATPDFVNQESGATANFSAGPRVTIGTTIYW